jgi:hypothetical protein
VSRTKNAIFVGEGEDGPERANLDFYRIPMCSRSRFEIMVSAVPFTTETNQPNGDEREIPKQKGFKRKPDGRDQVKRLTERMNGNNLEKGCTGKFYKKDLQRRVPQELDSKDYQQETTNKKTGHCWLAL